MAGTFIVNGTSTTIAFTYTAPTTTVLAIVPAAAHYLWDHGYGDHGTEEIPIEFADLTNQQKLNLVDAYIRQTIIDLANTYKSIAAQDAARLTEEENEYTL